MNLKKDHHEYNARIINLDYKLALSSIGWVVVGGVLAVAKGG